MKQLINALKQWYYTTFRGYDDDKALKEVEYIIIDNGYSTGLSYDLSRIKYQNKDIIRKALLRSYAEHVHTFFYKNIDFVIELLSSHYYNILHYIPKPDRRIQEFMILNHKIEHRNKAIELLRYIDEDLRFEAIRRSPRMLESFELTEKQLQETMHYHPTQYCKVKNPSYEVTKIAVSLYGGNIVTVPLEQITDELIELSIGADCFAISYLPYLIPNDLSLLASKIAHERYEEFFRTPFMLRDYSHYDDEMWYNSALFGIDQLHFYKAKGFLHE